MIEQRQFHFPDEEDNANEVKITADSANSEYEIIIDDDTPEEDKVPNHQRKVDPQSAKEMEDGLEESEIEKYDKEAKEKIRQAKRLMHEERRERERMQKEHEVAIDMARRATDENKRLRNTLDYGANEYAQIAKAEAESSVALASRMYKDAYDSGDSDKLVEAQNLLSAAHIKMERAKSFDPRTLQNRENMVKDEQVRQQPEQEVVYDARQQAWRRDNPWYGTDDEMTSLALGTHRRFVAENGDRSIGSEEYWSEIDESVRKRFPEKFDEDTKSSAPRRRSDNKTVVAPAGRSSPTSKKRVHLNAHQVNVIKKLGITPESYVDQYLKLEA